MKCFGGYQNREDCIIIFFIIDEKDKKNIPVIDKITLKKSLKILAEEWKKNIFINI